MSKELKKISDDYHDYVFQDGKLVGEFDAMYTFSKEVPWHQDTAIFSEAWETGLLLTEKLIANRTEPFEKILEVGCGLGYFISRFGVFGKELYGSDVSAVALEKARDLHPEVQFFEADLTNKIPVSFKQFDLVLVPEVLWYVLDHLETVKKNITDLVKPEGFLLLKQYFPGPEKPFVGKEIFSNPDALIQFWSHFKKIDEVIIQDEDSSGCHFWFVGEKK